MLTALLKLRAQLEGSLGRTPTLAELAAEAELPLEKVVECAATRSTPVSLDEPVRDDGDAELGDFVEDRNALARSSTPPRRCLPGEVAKVLSVLDERERTILTLRFGLDGGGERTLEEVAEHFGLTRERIRQIEARAHVEAAAPGGRRQGPLARRELTPSGDLRSPAALRTRCGARRGRSLRRPRRSPGRPRRS